MFDGIFSEIILHHIRSSFLNNTDKKKGYRPLTSCDWNTKVVKKVDNLSQLGVIFS
jgi:hypothetical protein